MIFPDSSIPQYRRSVLIHHIPDENDHIIASMLSGGDEFKFVKKRKRKTTRNSKQAWDFILTWDDSLFQRQFRISKEDFFVICNKMKDIYPSLDRMEK